MITIYVNEILRILQKNWKIILLNIVGFTSMVVLIGLSMSYYIDKANYRDTLEDSYGNKSFYKVLYDGEIPDLYQKVYSTDAIFNVKMAFDELSKSPDFEFHYTDVQAVFFMDKADVRYEEKFLDGYETGFADDNGEYAALKAVYADKLFFSDSHVVLAEGTAFNEQDYIFSDGFTSVPVILGANYAQYYQIGDVIPNANFWDETNITLLVVGFLAEDSYFYDNNNEQVVLNRYMILPDVEVENQSECSESFFLGAYSGTKLMNARIVCNNGMEEQVISSVNRILNENELYDFYLFDESSGAERILEKSKEFTWIGLLITVLSLVVCTAMLILGSFSRILQEVKNYSIYILIGFGKAKIFIFSVLEILMIFIPANIISFCVFAKMYTSGFDSSIFHPSIVLTIVLTELIVMIVSALITAYKIHSTDLSSVIRQKD